MTGRALEPEVRLVGDLPGRRQEWVIATAQVSGLLLSLRGADDVPELFRDGTALRAWAGVVRPVMDRVADGDAVEVPVADLAVVAEAAATLGSLWCRARVTGTDTVVSRLLDADASAYHTTPGWIIAHLARVHGVLTAADPDDARFVWRAGAG